MNDIESKISGQVLFWGILGPFITLLTFLILFIQPISDPIFPIMMLAGGAICWKWRMKGPFFSLPLLIITFWITFPKIPPSSHLWYFGLGLAITLSYFVTCLTQEEAEQLIQKLEKESKNRLDHLLKFDEKLKASKEECESHLKKLSAIEEEKQIEDQNVQKLSEKLNQTLKQINDFKSSAKNYEKSYLKALNQIEEEKKLQQEIVKKMNLQMANYEREKQLLEQELENSKQEIFLLQQREQELGNQTSNFLSEINKLNKEKEEAYALQKNQKGKSLTFWTLEGMYLQLKEQFKGKSTILEKTRKELFEKNEQILALQKEMKELMEFDNSPTEEILIQEMIKLEEDYKTYQKETEQELGHLYEIINKTESFQRQEEKGQRLQERAKAKKKSK